MYNRDSITDDIMIYLAENYPQYKAEVVLADTLDLYYSEIN